MIDPIKDNEMAGLVKTLRAMSLGPRSEASKAADAIATLQAKLAEVEADLALHRVMLAAAVERSDRFEDERDALQAQVTEARAAVDENRLNDQCWDFVSWCAEKGTRLSGHAFNDIKPKLREIIEAHLTPTASDAAQQGES